MGFIKAAKVFYDYITKDEEAGKDIVVHAIKGVDLDVEQGQFIAILGHNGSGKSTLAKHLNALLVPTEGTIWVGDMDTSDGTCTLAIRQSTGMVFQNPDNQIIASLVEEDVAFGPENLGVPTDEIINRVAESLESVGMTAYRNHSSNKLSGGQKQRVAIAGVLAMEPKCIVMDEPTAMLDPNGRAEVMKAIMTLNKEKGVTVILITHYMDEVTHADRVFVMDHGQVVMQGTPRDIFAKASALKSLGLEIPQAAALAQELKEKGFRLPLGILTADELTEAITAELDRLKGMRQS